MKQLRFYPDFNKECQHEMPEDKPGKGTFLIPVYDRMGDTSKPVMYLRPSYQYEGLALLNGITTLEVQNAINEPPKSIDNMDLWMVKQNVEYAKTEGLDAVVSRLKAQGYYTVANAVIGAFVAPSLSTL